MKNPYAPGFWCAVAAVVLLSATYFYGIMLAHQIDKALHVSCYSCVLSPAFTNAGGWKAVTSGSGASQRSMSIQQLCALHP